MDLLDQIANSVRSESAAEGRYWGFVTGKVTDTNDPKSLGRVKAQIAAQQRRESSDWLVPVWPGAVEGIPKKNEPVIVGFIDGDPNKGFYLWFPQTNTKDRASNFMLLGTVFVKMYNNLAAQYNTLRSDFHTFVTVTYNLHMHATAAPGAPSVPTVVGTGTTATAVQKAKDSAGTEVAAVTTGEIVLSARAKVAK